MVGNNQDEWVLFDFESWMEPSWLDATADQLLCAVSAVLGDDLAKRVLQLYPVNPNYGGDNRILYSEIMTDLVFRCPNMKLAGKAQRPT